MRRFLLVVMAVFLAAYPAPDARSQDFDSLFWDFDARSLTKEDKRFLQAALAFEGHYKGMLDGAWGRLSQNALEVFSSKEFGTDAEDWHMAMLAMSFFERIEADGWNMHHFSRLGMSMMLPTKTLIIDPQSSDFLNYRHSRSSLSISIGALTQAKAQGMHDFTIGRHELSTNPYSVRKTNFAVSSGTRRDGSTLYTRSNFVNGSWLTVMLSADKRDENILNAVASSIALGKVQPLAISPGGHLERTLARTMEAVAAIEEQERQGRVSEPSSAPPPSKPDDSRKSGSGFFVSASGHVLTNAHVVSGCRDVLVDGEKAQLTSISEEFDLAIVKTFKPDNKTVAVFSPSPAKLNSDVTAIGYPYFGILGGLNVTRGSVSSLKGLGGDATTMQISAPVQTGNSGGPLLGSDGEVVGVVVSKLDSIKVSDALGDVPQNVNFAVRGEIAKLFLAQNGVDPLLGFTDDPLEPELLAKNALGFTVFVECR
ncbi:S1C family serine protease [Marimonas arenosa]|uniref:Serine protease n=1 Tax=Marimonas arenosa TaxID=1795305 RepID=A0AAE3WF46_9RHOB|nr:serine protease [Marimonas arenosa]MDQ2091373.1 serine protease [Marimonas arenosa]